MGTMGNDRPKVFSDEDAKVGTLREDEGEEGHGTEVGGGVIHSFVPSNWVVELFANDASSGTGRVQDSVVVADNWRLASQGSSAGEYMPPMSAKSMPLNA